MCVGDMHFRILCTGSYMQMQTACQDLGSYWRCMTGCDEVSALTCQGPGVQDPASRRRASKRRRTAAAGVRCAAAAAVWRPASGVWRAAAAGRLPPAAALRPAAAVWRSAAAGIRSAAARVRSTSTGLWGRAYAGLAGLCATAADQADADYHRQQPAGDQITCHRAAV